MHNSELQINYTNFDSVYDNAVKPALTSWEELSSLLVSGHPVVVGDKLSLPSFSVWRFKNIDDPTVDHGTDRNGKPLMCFSETHVRRLKSNLVEMSMLLIDFDGGMTIEEARKRFEEYENSGYTSLRHLHEGKHRFRMALPFAHPMSKADFRRLHHKIKKWIDGDSCDTADKATYTEGQVFLLPAVYEADVGNARAWRNEGVLLDWRMFESISLSAVESEKANATITDSRRSEHQLMPNDVLETALGPIKVGDIRRKISKVRCPFHDDYTPSEFVDVSNSGRPRLVCKKCGTIYMWRSQGDGIVNGLAMIAERKRLRAEREPKQ
ncbi:hypothetical protein [Burkholderia pseudomallei]|uniref:hypothetical protein n=1 Tax=Burkholderia pseudomallei TaxID=28450 RepID=UPI000538AA48|nr:hypothetical protein [Burkholderia pseudomallei]KGW92108.1 hypothetical protein Y048_4542 [Burkholderia pseudomallei MSHR456]